MTIQYEPKVAYNPTKILLLVRKMVPKERSWDNWSTTDELSRSWKVSQRRVQQILKSLFTQDEIEVGVLVVDIGSTNPVSKPIYRRIEK